MIEKKAIISLNKSELNQESQSINEKAVLLYLNVEKKKVKFGETITEEYNEKIILYGYVIVS
jgi:hypothetical protein